MHNKLCLCAGAYKPTTWLYCHALGTSSLPVHVVRKGLQHQLQLLLSSALVQRVFKVQILRYSAAISRFQAALGMTEAIDYSESHH